MTTRISFLFLLFSFQLKAKPIKCSDHLVVKFQETYFKETKTNEDILESALIKPKEQLLKSYKTYLNSHLDYLSPAQIEAEIKSFENQIEDIILEKVTFDDRQYSKEEIIELIFNDLKKIDFQMELRLKEKFSLRSHQIKKAKSFLPDFLRNNDFSSKFQPIKRFGPIKSVKKTKKTRDIKSIRTLKLSSYNTKDFGKKIKIDGDLYARPEYRISLKSESLASDIQNSNSDIVVLQEIIEIDNLEIFKTKFLPNYRIIYIQGNSDRNIAFLVKKDLPFSFKLSSSKDYTSGKKKKVFTHDFQTLFVFEENKFSPVLALSGVHLKSNYGTEKELASLRRQNELKSIINYKSKIEEMFGDIPYFTMGDFNTDVNYSKDLDAYKKNMHSILKNKNTFIGKVDGKIVQSSIDGIFINDYAKRENIVLETKVERLFNLKNKNLKDEAEFPSDHAMISTTIDFTKIIDE